MNNQSETIEEKEVKDAEAKKAKRLKEKLTEFPEKPITFEKRQQHFTRHHFIADLLIHIDANILDIVEQLSEMKRLIHSYYLVDTTNMKK